MSWQKDIPKEFELWVCARTKACRWAGKESELHYAPQPDKGVRSYRGCCPNCGKSSFYVRDARIPRTKEEANEAMLDHGPNKIY